ncbi:class I SAM-dependent methyltransferase [Patescibacteria group bacterium]|nr:class I SAM-dependent methyltransferase [Patescibacteria group bacterium]
MRILGFGLPSLETGLRRALRLTLPDGNAVDLGAGSGMYTRPLARRFPGKTIAYDSSNTAIEQLCERLGKKPWAPDITCQNVLHLQIPPNTLASACIGMTGFVHKEAAESLYAMVWAALLPGGILHGEFATHRDDTEQSVFILSGCVELPPGSGSYYHSCGHTYCQHTLAGILGGSYWDVDEIHKFVKALGPVELIHANTYEWHQKVEDGGSVQRWLRSIHTITVQKQPRGRHYASPSLNTYPY